MAGERVPEADQSPLIVAASLAAQRGEGLFLAVAFPDSKSANLPLALAIAKSAPVHGREDIGGRYLTWAGFSDSLPDIQKAHELVHMVSGWAGSFIKVRGGPAASPMELADVLRCYLAGARCGNHAAHCCMVLDSPPTNTRRIFPCKLMLIRSRVSGVPFAFASEEVAPLVDQIRAAAAARGIDVCPLFDPSRLHDDRTPKMRGNAPGATGRIAHNQPKP
jgi:hypothetical protein